MEDEIVVDDAAAAVDLADGAGGDESPLSLDDAAASLLTDDPAAEIDGGVEVPAAKPAAPAAAEEAPADDLIEVAGADGAAVKLSKAALIEAAKAHLPPSQAADAPHELTQQYLAVVNAGMRQLVENGPRPLTAEQMRAILEDDPIEGPGKIQLHQAAVAEHREKLQALADARQEALARAQNDLQRHMAGEREKLLKALPEWSDKAVAKREQGEIREYLAKAGFSADEIAQTADHRMVVVARKAAAYDALMAKQPAVAAKVRAAPAYTKPGAAADPAAANAARARFHKSGSVEDAAALLA